MKKRSGGGRFFFSREFFNNIRRRNQGVCFIGAVFRKNGLRAYLYYIFYLCFLGKARLVQN